jgi:GTP-binding protein Era
MEIGLLLRLVAPPACISRRRALPPSCAIRGSSVRASRRERSSRSGAVASGGLSYSVVEEEVDEEGEEDEGGAELMRPRLELIEKPDRNLALLDEYESEELGASLCANHRSGEAFSSVLHLHVFVLLLEFSVLVFMMC